MLPHPYIILFSLAGILGVMFVFIVGRRAWRSFTFRRLDRFREYWLRRLPNLLAGDIPTADEMRSWQARETLESLLIRQLEASQGEDGKQIIGVIERAGLLDFRIWMLRQGSRWDRLHATSLLGQFRSPASVPALAEVLEDRWPQLRAAALRSLAMIGSSTAGPRIIGALKRGLPVEPNVWLDAAVACTDDPEDFLPLLQDERETVRVLAARAIAESPTVVGFESLNHFVSHPDPEVRSQLLRALGRTKDDRAIPLLIAATTDETWFVRLRALAALADLGATVAVEAVLNATADQNFHVRQRASATLASFGTHPAEIVEMLLKRKDRYALEGYLSQLARAGIIWRTVPLLNSPEMRVQHQAEEFLGFAVGAGYYSEILNATETHSDWKVRTAAARLLTRFSHPMLAGAVEARLAAVSMPRMHRILRAILRSQQSLAGGKSLGSMAHFAQ
ncbi:MAG: HEAT repeat domain-containing protein [Acidobacteria bacterium]|nr:HEAT repeat domain-containing protein [Acidobacteriota bacterium]